MNWLKYGAALAVLTFAVAYRLLTQEGATLPQQKSFTIACKDLSRACVFSQQGLKIRLSSDVAIKAMQPFMLRLQKLDQLDYRPVQVRYIMSAMDMGKNEFSFEKTHNGFWQAKSLLPFCGSGSTEWIAIILFEQAGQRAFELRVAFQIN